MIKDDEKFAIVSLDRFVYYAGRNDPAEVARGVASARADASFFWPTARAEPKVTVVETDDTMQDLLSGNVTYYGGGGGN